MKPRDRQVRILELMRVYQREMKVEEIAELFEVSPLTIRRDLDALAEDKALIRTHGGCIHAGRLTRETEYHSKVARNFDLKKAIAQTAIEHLGPDDVVLLNDGSTTFHVGLEIGARGGYTVYTNSLAMIGEFGRFRNTRLFLLPGEYDEDHYSIRGSLTEKLLEEIRFDVVFLGTDAIDDEGRCLVSTPEEARLAGIMRKAGNKAVLVADHTKLGAIGHIPFSRLEEFDAWITDTGITPEKERAFSEMTSVHTVTPV